jgi:CheY-like chemotaxis protein
MRLGPGISCHQCGAGAVQDRGVFSMMRPTLPNGRLPESQPTMHLATNEALASRVRELETLCAEVYVAAVELGFPQPLLNRLWTVAAQGSTPQAYDVEMPPRSVAGAGGIKAAPAKAAMPIPDSSLTDRPRQGADARERAPQPELKEVVERRTVLVVDDDQMMLAVLVRILQRENYTLLSAGGGPAALQLAGAHPDKIDLLITDYAMPDMRGRELADKMRERYSGIKVLYQTGFSDMLFQDRVELEADSAFLEKPFTARGLREAARIILFGSINPETRM